MADVTVTVTGTIAKAGVSPHTSGKLQFILTPWEIDDVAGEIITTKNVEAVIGSSGEISIDLWPNSRGTKASTYKVYHLGETSAGDFTDYWGEISVPEGEAPHLLWSLFTIRDQARLALYVGLISKAQYDTFLSSVSAAGEAQEAAETAQAAAESAAEVAETYAGVDHREATWSALSAIVGTTGDVGYVDPSDTGSHTDPVAAGTVPNEGIYRWSDNGAGSSYAERIGSTGLATLSAELDQRVKGGDLGTEAFLAVVDSYERGLLALEPGLFGVAGWLMRQSGTTFTFGSLGDFWTCKVDESTPAYQEVSDELGTFQYTSSEVIEHAGMRIQRESNGRVTLSVPSGAPLVLDGTLDLPADPDATPIGFPAAAITALNAWDSEEPADAAPPPIFSTDAGTWGAPLSHLAADVAITGTRTWVIYYGGNEDPADFDDQSYGILAYCDDLERGVWHQVLFFLPGDVDHHVRDPRISTLPDGRLLLLPYTNGTKRQATYACIIANPEARSGAFELGRLYFLDYGCPGAVIDAGGELRVPLDEWMIGSGPFTDDEGKHYCKIAPFGRDGVSTTRISDAPYDSPSINNYDESSAVTISGGRTRYWYRVAGGLRTVLSNAGDLTWGSTEDWTLYPVPASRAAFKRSPSGRIVGVINNSEQRRNLTVILSEDDGVTFPHSLPIESRYLDSTQYPSYPAVTFDRQGNIVAVAEFGRGPNTSAPQLGKQILLFKVSEDLVRAGTATEADVRKYMVAN